MNWTQYILQGAFVLIHVCIQKILSEGVQLWQHVIFIAHLERAIIGPQAKHHLNGLTIPLVGRLWTNIECLLGSFVIFKQKQTNIA